MNRFLSITFFENRDVQYEFSRTPGFTRYSIEYPFNKTVLINESELLGWNFEKNISNQGFITYSNKSTDLQNNRISYLKNEYLDLIQDDPILFRYKESHTIKYDSINESSHVITIHDRNKRISVVKSKSQSIFFAQSDGLIHTCGAFYRYSHGYKYGNYVCSEHKVVNGETILLKPTELVQAVFYCKGVLNLDWILEMDESLE